MDSKLNLLLKDQEGENLLQEIKERAGKEDKTHRKEIGDEIFGRGKGFRHKMSMFTSTMTTMKRMMIMISMTKMITTTVPGILPHSVSAQTLPQRMAIQARILAIV